MEGWSGRTRRSAGREFHLGGYNEQLPYQERKTVGGYDPNYTTSAFNVGLLCGSVTSSSVVDYCSAEGVIKGFQQVGGLVGSPWNKAVIKTLISKEK